MATGALSLIVGATESLVDRSNVSILPTLFAPSVAVEMIRSLAPAAMPARRVESVRVNELWPVARMVVSRWSSVVSALIRTSRRRIDRLSVAVTVTMSGEFTSTVSAIAPVATVLEIGSVVSVADPPGALGADAFGSQLIDVNAARARTAGQAAGRIEGTRSRKVIRYP